MSEQDKPKSYEERIAACPIHKWADIDEYLDRAFLPQTLRRPFHELVLSRGEFPKNMSHDQGKLFGKKAVENTKTYEMLPTEAHALRILFGQLIEQWLAAEANNN